MSNSFNLLRENCMIDLETTGTHFDAGILSIGAVKFDHTGILDQFYANVKLTSIKRIGMHIDPDTLKWWKEQKPEAIESLFRSSISIEDALDSFNSWYGDTSLPTWSCGIDFDSVIMRNAFKKTGRKEPWEYWHGNCFRTLKGLIDPDKTLQPYKNEELHNALSDAKHQALWCVNMWKVWAGSIDSV